MKSERWTTPAEIQQNFPVSTDPSSGAGPIVYAAKNGKRFVDDGESHIAVIGRTGSGKSQCCSLPYIREVLRHGESLVVLDPKGEAYRCNASHIPDNYQKLVIDFRNPRRSPNKWNPLSAPYHLFRSDPDDVDICSATISELWNTVYPYDGKSDRFWSESAVNYARGLTYGLFEYASNEEYVNIATIADMMQQSERRLEGTHNTIINEFCNNLPPQSLAKANLETYVSAPTETRACIHSTAAAGIEVFSRSKGLMELLGTPGEDNLDILSLDVNRPFFLAIIIPDETDTYNSLAALLISQVSQHLIRVAQDMGGRLPIRVNYVLEELGSVGKSIPLLPTLMVASRSRNMRLMLILQSTDQLVDIYGISKAEIINSCIGITFAFSTNHWGTLQEWQQRCGLRQVEHDGWCVITEPLITANQLAAMSTGTALVMIDNKYKYITHFPFFYEIYREDSHTPSTFKPAEVRAKKKVKTLDFKSIVIKMKNSVGAPTSAKQQSPLNNSPFFSKPPVINLPIVRMDPQSAVHDENSEDDADPADPNGSRKYRVKITDGNRLNIARVLAAHTKDKLLTAYKMVPLFPVEIDFDSKSKAKAFIKDVIATGGSAELVD